MSNPKDIFVSGGSLDIGSSFVRGGSAWINISDGPLTVIRDGEEYTTDYLFASRTVTDLPAPEFQEPTGRTNNNVPIVFERTDDGWEGFFDDPLADSVQIDVPLEVGEAPETVSLQFQWTPSLIGRDVADVVVCVSAFYRAKMYVYLPDKTLKRSVDLSQIVRRMAKTSSNDIFYHGDNDVLRKITGLTDAPVSGEYKVTSFSIGNIDSLGEPGEPVFVISSQETGDTLYLGHPWPQAWAYDMTYIHWKGDMPDGYVLKISEWGVSNVTYEYQDVSGEEDWVVVSGAATYDNGWIISGEALMYHSAITHTHAVMLTYEFVALEEDVEETAAILTNILGMGVTDADEVCIIHAGTLFQAALDRGWAYLAVYNAETFERIRSRKILMNGYSDKGVYAFFPDGGFCHGTCHDPAYETNGYTYNFAVLYKYNKWGRRQWFREFTDFKYGTQSHEEIYNVSVDKDDCVYCVTQGVVAPFMTATFAFCNSESAGANGEPTFDISSENVESHFVASTEWRNIAGWDMNRVGWRELPEGYQLRITEISVVYDGTTYDVSDEGDWELEWAGEWSTAPYDAGAHIISAEGQTIRPVGIPIVRIDEMTMTYTFEAVEAGGEGGEGGE